MPACFLTPQDLRGYLQQRSGRIGFVPTMGALHEGHLSLVSLALQTQNTVVVSIFVNPTQFGPTEDFNKYPRDLDSDRNLLDSLDLLPHQQLVVFTPDVATLYGPNPNASTVVRVPEMDTLWCGHSRPGHFQGVASVVLRLLNIVRPHALYLGEKDFQQLTIIQKMVRDLWVDVQVVGAPIVREPDGLAMSSRNRYLTASQRQLAPQLFRQLELLRTRFEAGDTNAKQLVASMDFSGMELDYCAIVSSVTLHPVIKASQGDRVLVAAKLGSTRLIDNITL